MKPYFYVVNGLICLSQAVSAQTWNALGNLNAGVSNILVVENEIYVTGGFTNASGNEDADYIARWDGNSWHAVMPNAPNQVVAIVKSGNDFYVGGNFTNAGGNPAADYIARWDGVSWNPLGSGLNDLVVDIAVSGNDVYVVGDFSDAGGNEDADRIAHWDGDSWNAMGTPPLGLTVLDLALRQIEIAGDGKIYVGGRFVEIGGVEVRNIAWWDENGWHALGNGFYGDMGVNAIAVDGNDVYVGGDGGAGIVSCGIVRWDGIFWHSLGAGLSHCIYGEGAYEIAAANGNVYVSGWFADADDVPHTTGLAHWDGSTWNAMGTPGFQFGNWPGVIAIAGDDVYVGGGFLQIGDVPNSSFIARWGEPQVVSATEDLNPGHRDALSVYPNPAHDVVHYTLDNNVLLSHTLTLTDANGRVIVRKETQESKLNIQYHPTGLYFLHVQNLHINGIAKVVKY